MAVLESGELFRVLIECAGESEGGALTDAVLDTEFEDLGYDSLALMEVAATIRQRIGVVLPDERIADVRTPRDLLDLINGTPVEAR
jgi:act minimal PKS acyl carrier protein